MKILLEKSIFLGGNKMLNNTCITVIGSLVEINKTIHWEIKKIQINEKIKKCPYIIIG